MGKLLWVFIVFAADGYETRMEFDSWDSCKGARTVVTEVYGNDATVCFPEQASQQ